jgi:mannose-6-phosphate isomerase-like protein (cupin superfamily)
MKRISFAEKSMEISRRQLCGLLPLLALPLHADETRIPSRVADFNDLPVEKATNGAEFRRLVIGKGYNSIPMEIHETILPAGGAPHPAHRHPGDELFFIMKGTVEVTINGKSSKLGPGGAAYAAGGDEHGIRNAGNEPAQYFVATIGPETAS